MLRRWIAGKIHNIHVTDAKVDYHGSVSIDSELLRLAGIEPYQEVDVINLNNGARWTTYALLAGPGEFTLNGGGARLGVPGDPCVILAYAWAETFPGGWVVYCDDENRPAEVFRYEPGDRA